MMSHRRTPLILVVDDDPTTNRMLQGMLVRGGFRVVQAGSVAEALVRVTAEPPDLVLLDVQLPDGSGFDLCRRLHNGVGLAASPVLFISSNEDIAAKVMGFDAGGVDYITKPLAGAEVLARVSTHLRLKHASERLVELQAEQIQRLAGAQVTLMPLPDDLPEAAFSVALVQVLRAGGDFYDVIPVGDGVIDYVVADASGHNLAASFWTASLKALLGEYAQAARPPLGIVQAINGALCRILPEGTFFTLLYARLNRQTARLTVVNAGNPPALLLRRQEHQIEPIGRDGDVAGAFNDAVFGVTEVPVRRGDRLFLYSDGVVELSGSRSAGMGRLRQACLARGSESLGPAVQGIQQGMTEGISPEDDLLLMGVDV